MGGDGGNLHRRNHAAMHNGFLEGQRRCVVAPLGFGSIFLAFPNRFSLLPRQITRSRNKLLDI